MTHKITSSNSNSKESKTSSNISQEQLHIYNTELRISLDQKISENAQLQTENDTLRLENDNLKLTFTSIKKNIHDFLSAVSDVNNRLQEVKELFQSEPNNILQVLSSLFSIISADPIFSLLNLPEETINLSKSKTQRNHLKSINLLQTTEKIRNRAVQQKTPDEITIAINQMDEQIEENINVNQFTKNIAKLSLAEADRLSANNSENTQTVVEHNELFDLFNNKISIPTVKASEKISQDIEPSKDLEDELWDKYFKTAEDAEGVVNLYASELLNCVRWVYDINIKKAKSAGIKYNKPDKDSLECSSTITSTRRISFSHPVLTTCNVNGKQEYCIFMIYQVGDDNCCSYLNPFEINNGEFIQAYTHIRRNNVFNQLSYKTSIDKLKAQKTSEDAKDALKRIIVKKFKTQKISKEEKDALREFIERKLKGYILKDFVTHIKDTDRCIELKIEKSSVEGKNTVSTLLDYEMIKGYRLFRTSFSFGHAASIFATSRTGASRNAIYNLNVGNTKESLLAAKTREATHNFFLGCSKLFEPLTREIQNRILQSSNIHIDETVSYLNSYQGHKLSQYFWGMCSGATEIYPYFLLLYGKTRECHKNLPELLNFGKTLPSNKRIVITTDGYSPYLKEILKIGYIFKNEDNESIYIEHSGCLVHFRRKVYDLLSANETIFNLYCEIEESSNYVQEKFETLLLEHVKSGDINQKSAFIMYLMFYIDYIFYVDRYVNNMYDGDLSSQEAKDTLLEHRQKISKQCFYQIQSIVNTLVNKFNVLEQKNESYVNTFKDAIGYICKYWMNYKHGLTKCLEDANVSLSNNILEGLFRLHTLMRNAYKCIDSEDGCHAICILMTILQNCYLAQVDIQEYVCWYLLNVQQRLTNFDQQLEQEWQELITTLPVEKKSFFKERHNMPKPMKFTEEDEKTGKKTYSTLGRFDEQNPHPVDLIDVSDLTPWDFKLQREQELELLYKNQSLQATKTAEEPEAA